MKILHLTLNKPWYNMIESGVKLEEYRDIKPYWVSRLTFCDAPKEEKNDNKYYAQDFCFDVINGHSTEDALKAYYAKFKHFDAVQFRNGYSAAARQMLWECMGITFGWGRLSWGAVYEKEYFVIKLGERLKP